MTGPAYEIGTITYPETGVIEVWFDKKIYAEVSNAGDAERILAEIRGLVAAGRDPNDPLERVRILGPAGEAFPDPAPRAPVERGAVIEVPAEILAEIAAEQGRLSGQLAAIFVRLSAIEQKLSKPIEVVMPPGQP